MTSSPSEFKGEALFEIDEKSDAVAHFVSLVGAKIQEAFLHRKMSDGLTQQGLAAALDVDRSRIHRCLSGYSNLTLESVAELAWAMRGTPLFSIALDDEKTPACNHFSAPRVIAASSTTTSSTPPSRINNSPVARTHFNRVVMAE